VFAQEAEALASQVLVTSTLPDGLDSREGTVEVSLSAGGSTYTDSAFAVLRSGSTPVAASQELQTAPAGQIIPTNLMFAGLGALGLGLLVVLLVAMGVFAPRRGDSINDRLGAYGSRSSAHRHRATAAGSGTGVKGSATVLAERALSSNKGFEASLGARLDAAGMSMKPAEWLLLQVGAAFMAGLVGMLIGSLFLAVLLVVLGLVGPYLYLRIKQRSRIKAFNDQLAETLQLMAGSLSAGLSFAQSADTVVREGSDPMASEFKRALVETRLGVTIEDALESVAARMQSEDFKWVVMAVKIQREVGGNLAEVLNQVSGTIRERGYLRRQVRSLSAEGRLSAWILGAMPPAMFVYFMTVRPEYMDPLFQSLFGWGILVAGFVLMGVGAFWMSRLVKLEV
jgi:tight adherence protein B